MQNSAVEIFNNVCHSLTSKINGSLTFSANQKKKKEKNQKDLQNLT